MQGSHHACKHGQNANWADMMPCWLLAARHLTSGKQGRPALTGQPHSRASSLIQYEQVLPGASLLSPDVEAADADLQNNSAAFPTCPSF